LLITAPSTGSAWFAGLYSFVNRRAAKSTTIQTNLPSFANSGRLRLELTAPGLHIVHLEALPA
jgi:hypothetical protein